MLLLAGRTVTSRRDIVVKFAIVVAHLGDQMGTHFERIREPLAGEAQNLLELSQRPFGVIGHDLDVCRRHLGQVAPAECAKQPQGPFEIGKAAAKAEVARLQVLAHQRGGLNLVELPEARFQTSSFAALGTRPSINTPRPPEAQLCYVAYANV